VSGGSAVLLALQAPISCIVCGHLFFPLLLSSSESKKLFHFIRSTAFFLNWSAFMPTFVVEEGISVDCFEIEASLFCAQGVVPELVAIFARNWQSGCGGKYKSVESFEYFDISLLRWI
jgi:hypothetical protein